jgi:dihydroorotase
MHDGAVSRALGIPGMPAEGETQMVERDIGLVRETGGRLHVLHVSARRTVEVIRAAKAEGLPVTCEACPHHFTLTEEDIRVYGTAAKMSPPLRTADDVEAIIEGLADGTIDAIATDHAPHTDEEKLRSFAEAPNGILGLETAVGSVFDELVEPGALSAADAIRKLTIEPARILGIDAGTLSIGAAADVTVIDPDMEWQVDAHAFASKSRNTPFHGWTMNGRAVLTVLGGRVTYRTGER